MTTGSSQAMQVAQDAYTADDTRPALSEITESASDLKSTADGYATYEVDPADLTTISELLEWVNKNGYTGLTDEQIDQVVEYRAEVKATQQALIDSAEQLIAQGEQLQSDAKSAYEALQKSFEDACATRAKFESVEG